MIEKYNKDFDFLSVHAVKLILFGFTAVLAGVTVLTHVAQVLHMPFKLYALFCLIVGLFVLGGIIKDSLTLFSQSAVKDKNALLLIIMIGLFGSILTLIINRPASDDWIYVPDAIYYLQNPQTNMGFETRFIYTEGAPLLSGFPKPYEYGQAVIAYYAGTEYLFIYHIFTAAVVGFLIPLSLFYAASQFSVVPYTTAIGTLITVFLVLLLAETHRTFGNMSFGRAFEGKILFLSAGIPMFAAFSLDYFKKFTFQTWLPVFTTATAMVGATSSAAVMVPALALVLAIVHLLAGGNWRKHVIVLLPYCAAFIYCLVYVLSIWSYAVSNLGIDSPINQAYPTTFSGHLGFFFNPELPLTPIFVSVSAIIGVIFCKERKRLLAWMIAVVALYLNPITAPFLIKHVTSPNIYWRLFYLFPFPLVVVIGVASIIARFGNFLNGKRLIIVTIASVLFFAILHYPLSGSSIFRKENGVCVDLLGYKLEQNVARLARQVIVVVPPGPMLAPLNISGTILMLTAKYPQMRNKNVNLYLGLTPRGQADDAELRIQASEFVSGSNLQVEAFRELILKHSAIRSIVMANSVWSKADIQQFCKINHFLSFQEINDDFVVVWK